MNGLTKKQITDKNGVISHRWVKSGAAEAKSDRSAGLVAAKSVVSSRTFSDFVSEPTDEDMAIATKKLHLELRDIIPSRNWTAVMGEDTEFNNETVAAFDESQKQFIADNLEHPIIRDALKKRAEVSMHQKAHTRAFDAGVETEFDRLFDAIWEDKQGRFQAKGVVTKSVVEHRLRILNRDRDVAQREGNERLVAELDSAIAIDENTVRVRGRSMLANIRRVAMESQGDISDDVFKPLAEGLIS